ncbi:MAG: ricin-type beta-trefoil lectin domain protein [Janthinobacterium lividum]
MLRAVLGYLALAIIGVWLLGPGQAKAAILSSGVQNAPYGGYSCADVVNNNTTPGARLQIFACHGGSNQDFEMIGSNILSLSGQRCLDVQGNGNGGATGTPVDSYTCTGGANQQWFYYKGELINMQHSLCLDATTFVNNTVLVVNACNGAASQQWQFK